MAIHRLRAIALGLALAALLIGSRAHGAQTESPVACPPAGVLEIAYGDHTTGCAIPVGGQQGLTFQGVAGDNVRLRGITHTNGLDLRVRIFPPDFVELPETGCTAAWNATCSFSHDLVLPETGQYTLSVTDLGNDEGGSFTLQLETIPVSAAEVGLRYEESESDTVSPQTDVDFFEFHGTAGTDVRLSLLTTTNGFDPYLEVLAPSGTSIAEGAAESAGCIAAWNATCSFQLDLVDLAETGTYRIVLSDAGVDENGSYQLTLSCIYGACEHEPGEPVAEGQIVSYVTAVLGSVSPQTGSAHYRFHGTPGTTIRLNVRSTTNGLDPRVEIRDPDGVVLEDGPADGAGCVAAWNATCSSSLDLDVTESGVHTLIVSDVGVEEAGNYQLSLHCMSGPCDSDADGLEDGYVSVLTYGDLFDLSISPHTDVDFFRFRGSPGSLVEISIVSLTNGLDPWFELWAPGGTEPIAVGAADGAGCTAAWNATCSSVYALPLPVEDGDYKIALWDGGIDEGGSYRIAVHCIAGSCSNATPNLVADDCIEQANGPAAPDPAGNVQLDTDGDGFGNLCDADHDNDGDVDAQDFSAYFLPDFRLTADGGTGTDLDGDGDVDATDFSLRFMPQFLQGSPGPSGLGCSASGPALCPAQR